MVYLVQDVNFKYVDSNEQNVLISKIETDSWIENRLTAVSGGCCRSAGIEKKREKNPWTQTTVW